MVIYEAKTWQTNSAFPDTNFIPSEDSHQPKWVVPDGSELAERIKNAYDWQPVEDGEGNLTDIIEIPYMPSRDEADRQRAEEIKRQLDDLDRQAVRPLRAVAAGTATDEDRDKLRDLEAQAETLRAELEGLGGGDD